MSDTIKLGVPLLAANLLKERKNVSADKSRTNSKCIARVTQHENNATYTLFEQSAQTFIKSGPAKSIPTLENGAACLTLNPGKSDTGASLYDFPSSLLQVTHLPTFV